ncbi:SH3 domain-containing protein [Treponema sp. C6A8]|uniref:SH3 domain-containing protein n=1 Tax=Treponema sp. C6A8 TaxID=1410609 RepID=UPI0004884C89|nr:SH3 domain-containing protein [Treponema sp. C6A8]
MKKNVSVLFVLLWASAIFISCGKNSGKQTNLNPNFKDISSIKDEISLAEKAEEEARKARELGLLGKKLHPDSVGDILFADGSAIAYNEHLYLTDEQKENAVAVIFYIGTECSDFSNNQAINQKRILGVGLHQKFLLDLKDEFARKNNIEAIQVNVKGTPDNYSFYGNKNGYKFWARIHDYVNHHQINLYVSNPDYFLAEQYASSYEKAKGGHLLKTAYENGWYLPSIAELYQLWKSMPAVNGALAICGGDKISKREHPFVSSSYSADKLAAFVLDFNDGSIFTENSDLYACAIRDFAGDQNHKIEKKRKSLINKESQVKGVYVDSLKGAAVYEDADSSSAKICELKHGDYLLVREIGNEDTIDGITDSWVKIVLYEDEWKSKTEEYGWIFAGNLSLQCPLSLEEMYEYMRKNDFYVSDFFPETGDYGYDFMRENTGWEWERQTYAQCEYILPNYISMKSGSVTAVTISDQALFLYMPETYGVYNSLFLLKTGTEVQLQDVMGYGLTQSGLLYPIYFAEYYDEENNASCVGLIRGVDITEPENICFVSDGKGGKMSLYCQPSLVAPGKNGMHSPSKEEIEEFLNNWVTYEVAYLRGGWKIQKALYIDSDGIQSKVDIDSHGNLSLVYPLNMEKPVPFIVERLYKGGNGGGCYTTKIYSLDPKALKLRDNYSAVLNPVCEYEYNDTDGGPTGTGWYYFTKDTLDTYSYEQEYGQVFKDIHVVWKQNSKNPYEFELSAYPGGEPSGNSRVKKTGEYVNPVCRLKMREGPTVNSEKLYTLEPGFLLKVLEEGETVKIDGLSSNWVKVQLVNDVPFVEGYKSENQTAGWVFGGYLE